MHFLMAGDEKYFIFMRENCVQVRTHYPNNPIYIYDFGLSKLQIEQLAAEFQPIEIINWHDNIENYQDIWESTSEEQRRKLALALNARQTGLRKRLRKALFKRFPNGRLAQSMKRRAVRFENLLLQKIKCMRDASDRAANERLVFLDADALLFQPIDDAFDDKSDITLTVLSELSWEHNKCFVFNSGVIYFGPNPQTRNRFLDAWWAESQVNAEWLREQTSLVRLIEKSVSRDAIVVGTQVEMVTDSGPVQIRLEACDEFNFFDMENREIEGFPDARVYHFTGRRQEPEMFWSLLSSLRDKYSQ